METYAPLADRIRPKSFDEFVGQRHLVGKKGIIRRMVESDQLFSMIFWGPPGSGKTTLAQIIANSTNSHFVHFSAVTTSLRDVRRVVKEASERLKGGQGIGQLGLGNRIVRTIVFVDEIHRFNKAQQDALLPHVEKGTIILIGATTENPSFEVIGPLLSRCHVYVLNQLDKDDLNILIDRSLKVLNRKIKRAARNFLLEASNGDARTLINSLEIVSSLIPHTHRWIEIDDLLRVFQKKAIFYDRLGEEHYNTISAYIKSMRAGDVNAALYYLARMVEAGEDPLFIARRMVVFASEDIGMAQPTALVVANEVFRACETIGYPECQENLAHGTVYLAIAKKNRSAVDAYFQALKDVQKYGNLPIPFNLRNAPTKLMKKLGYGSEYEPYPTKNQSLLPEKLKGRKYFPRRG